MSEYIITDEQIAENRRLHGKKLLVMPVIVRCRDCKWCMAYMAGTYCDYMAHAVELDGFCAWGDKKKS